MIDNIEKFIEEDLNQVIIDVDQYNDNEYWILLEFMVDHDKNCDLLEELNKNGICSAYDVDDWCNVMCKVNAKVENVCNEILKKFNIEDCYESSQICNGMYVIL